MTIDEAIKYQYILAERYKTVEECEISEFIESCRKSAKECKQIADWLEELKRLRERNTPKEPVELKDKFNDIYLVCPRCRTHIYYSPSKLTLPPYCMICGQALDWSEHIKVEKF